MVETASVFIFSSISNDKKRKEKFCAWIDILFFFCAFFHLQCEEQDWYLSWAVDDVKNNVFNKIKNKNKSDFLLFRFLDNNSCLEICSGETFLKIFTKYERNMIKHSELAVFLRV